MTSELVPTFQHARTTATFLAGCSLRCRSTVEARTCVCDPAEPEPEPPEIATPVRDTRAEVRVLLSAALEYLMEFSIVERLTTSSAATAIR